jgi:anaerobic selenocysteine-containing dehydrogenase
MTAQPRIGHTACPHDCPSSCALDVELFADGRIGRVRGSKDNSYTAGIVCAKVGRYAERQHHPDRLTVPLIRTGPKGSGQFRPISWDEALDRTAEAFLATERQFGTEAVWPYYYAGTMGQVQRDGINRLANVKRYSRFHGTICVNTAWPGFIAGTGKLAGPDPREMAKADLVVIWGTNAVATQIQVMTHASRAHRDRGAKLAVVDVYRTATMEQADIALIVRPGTDAALACAVMHVLFRDNLADRAYMARYADDPAGLEAHLASRTPEWAAAVTGLTAAEIETFAHAIGRTPRTFLRLGYGFTRQRNGAVAMHAAASIATVAGLWQHEGGGAFHSNNAIFKLNKTMIEGSDVADKTVRALDQSRVGAILTGEPQALAGGPPVKAMLIQNTNPMTVCPDQTKVAAGFGRDDLFVAVHEQFMTDTARMADIVLPAATFLEYDDIYRGGGHSHILLGPKLVEPPGEARDNHAVIRDLASRVGAEHPGFHMTARQHIDWLLRHSGWGTLAELEEKRFLDVQPDFRTAHYLDGFAWPDGKYRFRPDWPSVPYGNEGLRGPAALLPAFPDQWDVNEAADAAHPFKLLTPPARGFLNSTFTETRTSLARERGGKPCVMIHPDDAHRLGIGDGASVALANRRGRVVLDARVTDETRPGVLVSEGIFPNHCFADGRGINTLTGDDAVAPFGGVGFHDVSVALSLA